VLLLQDTLFGRFHINFESYLSSPEKSSLIFYLIKIRFAAGRYEFPDPNRKFWCPGFRKIISITETVRKNIKEIKKKDL
jgi:hypothetical protein